MFSPVTILCIWGGFAEHDFHGLLDFLAFGCRQFLCAGKLQNTPLKNQAPALSSL
jgi:hypothetical protein